MENVLLVSSSDKSNEMFTQLLKANDYTHITTAKNGGEARRLLLQNDFGIIIVNAPLSDEFGHELCFFATEKTSSGIILLVKMEIADDVSAKVEDFGIMVVSKPIGKQLFFQAIKLISASRRRILGLKSQNVKLQKKIEEMKLIDRAKCVLIQYLNMTEPQAHRYIEKQAMDLRTPKLEIAQDILKTYET